jgi:hypothetical protein
MEKLTTLYFTKAREDNGTLVTFNNGRGFLIYDEWLLERIARLCLETWQDEQKSPF